MLIRPHHRSTNRAFCSWRIPTWCIVHGSMTQKTHNNRDEYVSFNESNASPYPSSSAYAACVLFPSHQRTQWIVNKWKSRKRMTTMRGWGGVDDGCESMRMGWPLCKRIACCFSHGWKIFPLMNFSPDKSTRPGEFIIISFWYFKQWKSNINLIKSQNVLLISSCFLFATLRVQQWRHQHNHKTKSNEKRQRRSTAKRNNKNQNIFRRMTILEGHQSIAHSIAI